MVTPQPLNSRTSTAGMAVDTVRIGLIRSGSLHKFLCAEVSMNKRVYGVCAALALAAAPCFGAGPWDGTWKLNEAKSKLTGYSFTIEAKGNMMHMTSGSVSYDFACDGKPHPTTAGQTLTCMGSSAEGYHNVTRFGDKVLYESQRTLSADGKTLTVQGTETRPDGSTQSYTNVYKRESGTSGLVGRWMNVKSEGVAGSMVIETKGDWVKISFPEYKSTSEGKMDGRNIAVTGPDVPPETWTTIKAAGPNKLQYSDKYKDKVQDEGTLTLSADGKTLVDEEWVPGKMNEKTTAVYERQ